MRLIDVTLSAEAALMFSCADFGQVDKKSVHVDRQGRVVARFPVFDDFVLSSDDSLASLEEAIALNEGDDTIVDLMRRDVHCKGSGSRGSRRRQPKREPLKNSLGRTEGDEGLPMGSRAGRPLIGDEARVCVQTSVTRRTREMLLKYSMTLAEVFDGYARRVAAHGI